MGRRQSLIHEACVRFDDLRAIGVSRHEEKRRRRDKETRPGVTPPLLSLSTGAVHSFKTEETYKAIALRYAHWARAVYGVRRLADLDADAERYVALYLEARHAAGDSAHTLTTIRAALRMFHRPAYPPAEREARVRALGADVPLPTRRREDITRSRGAVAMDRALALERYHSLVAFCQATGLRRRELAALTVGDVHAEARGNLVVDVFNGKGGKSRVVPVLPGREDDVLALVIGRSPVERMAPRIPVRLDVQAYRRQYAQDLYTEGGRRSLPPVAGRLPRGSVDPDRALYVAHALGHARVDVVLRNYLR